VVFISLNVSIIRYVMAVDDYRKLSPAIAHHGPGVAGGASPLPEPLVGELPAAGTNFDLFQERSNTCR